MSNEKTRVKAPNRKELEELSKEMSQAFANALERGVPAPFIPLIELIETVQNDPAALEKLKQEIIREYGE